VQTYDSIIVGAGHNGLVCAAYLARKGHRVLVLEASDQPGGLAAGREFHPGFHCSVAHSSSHFPSKIVRELELDKHGFAPSAPLPTIGLRADQAHVTIADGALGGVTADDTAAYQSYQRLLHRFADALKPFWLKTIPGIGNNKLSELGTFAHIGLNIRRMGKKDMGEFLRITSLPMRDLMDEFFSNETLQATLAWDGLIGSKLAPRSPNGALIALFYRLAHELRGAHVIPGGGMAGLVRSLVAAAEAHGAEIRYSSPVRKITIEAGENGLQARGVKLADGQTIVAERVISATDPQQTFIGLVGVEHLDIGFTNRIRRLRCDGYVAKLHLALDGLPRIGGLEDVNGRMLTAATMDELEFAYDKAKYGELPDKPVMEFLLPSLHEPGLAPEGKHILSAHVMYVPYQLKAGWTSEARQSMCERAIDVIQAFAPGIRQQVIHSELLTPRDLEAQYRVTGGHWHHTELAMDQMLMMRPTYQAAQYSTPIPGLFLCSAGCHPGGDITGAAGHNAAQEILS
jgi:phytoene dehydrogenase-like protein